MAKSLLTEMREAIWNAVDHWPGLRSVFKRTWRFDGIEDPPPIELIPTPADLPTLSIKPSATSTPWSTNQQQRVTAVYDVELWTPRWNLRDGERLWQEFSRAMQQSRPPNGTSAPYVRAVCDDVTIVLPGTVLVGAVDDSKVTMTKWTWQLRLTKAWNPVVDAGHLE